MHPQVGNQQNIKIIPSMVSGPRKEMSESLMHKGSWLPMGTVRFIWNLQHFPKDKKHYKLQKGLVIHFKAVSTSKNIFII